MSQSSPTVSVVVPAYNAEATIAKCLSALNAQSFPRSEYEVVVVDDGSTDATAAIASQHGVRVLRQANSGPAVARNQGIAAARGEIVLFTDADCAPATDWIQEMAEPFGDREVAGVKGVYRTRQRNLTARFIQVEYEDRYDHTARCRYIDFIDTYAAGYRRNVLLASGGFDTHFPFASVEDQELSFRLARAGHRMVFNLRASVFHRHPESWRRYAQRKYRIGYWKTLVLRLHPSKVWRDSHTPASLKLQMALAALTAPLAGLSPLCQPCLWLLALIWAVFVASTAPFIAKAWRRDRAVALIALPVLVVRAWCLGLGLVAGYLDALRHRGPLASVSRGA